jgi:hypothetical protein
MTQNGDACISSLFNPVVDEDTELYDLQNINSVKDTIEGEKMNWSGGAA